MCAQHSQAIGIKPASVNADLADGCENTREQQNQQLYTHMQSTLSTLILTFLLLVRHLLITVIYWTDYLTKYPVVWASSVLLVVSCKCFIYMDVVVLQPDLLPVPEPRYVEEEVDFQEETKGARGGGGQTYETQL